MDTNKQPDTQPNGKIANQDSIGVDEKSPDSAGLGSTSCRPFFIGDPYSGYLARECPDFKPTLYELRELARYWYNEALGLSIHWFIYHSTSSSECGRMAYANRRFCQIEDQIGAEAAEEVIRAVELEMQRSVGDKTWDIFLNGDKVSMYQYIEKLRASRTEDGPVPGASPDS